MTKVPHTLKVLPCCTYIGNDIGNMSQNSGKQQQTKYHFEYYENVLLIGCWRWQVTNRRKRQCTPVESVQVRPEDVIRVFGYLPRPGISVKFRCNDIIQTRIPME